MLSKQWDGSNKVTFKYYGEFNTMKKIHQDCKDDLEYIGNSLIDGSPIFQYHYNINQEKILDFKKLNHILRKIKIKKYSNIELDKDERSILSFFKFFMNAYENYELKYITTYEIKRFTDEYDD